MGKGITLGTTTRVIIITGLGIEIEVGKEMVIERE